MPESWAETSGERLAILGASGHGRVVADAALGSGWGSISFFDDAWPILQVTGRWAVLGTGVDLQRMASEVDAVVIAIGNNRTRLMWQRQLVHWGLPLATVVHPSAIVSRYATLGAGSVLCAGAIVNPFARLGGGCIVNTAASVDHDCELADGVHISPGAHLGGQVTVGEATWIGIGANVRQCITIGSDTVVGAGAVVVSDIGSNVVVFACPRDQCTRASRRSRIRTPRDDEGRTCEARSTRDKYRHPRSPRVVRHK